MTPATSNAIWQFSIAPLQLAVWLLPLLLVLVLVVWKGRLRQWTLFTLIVTLILIMLGAYVRLSDAGLGCPDWPGCYGQLAPSSAKAQIAEQVKQLPDGPVTLPKAWKEMVHRYLATLVGVLIVGMLIKSWLAVKRKHMAATLSELNRSAAAQRGPLLLILAVVILQGLFGKWTVTLLLKPAIVTGHLMGGMLLLALLVWLWHRQRAVTSYLDPELIARLRFPALLGLAVLSIQIFLGGWTSTNYAALACTDIPLCQGSLMPAMNFQQAFQLIRPLGRTADGTFISMEALTAIHWTHRLGALVVFLVIGWLGVKVARAGDRPLAAYLHALLFLQIALGVSNVLFSLPLYVAVLHNGVAALLLGCMVVLNLQVGSARRKV